jgi:hypothetical protein
MKIEAPENINYAVTVVKVRTIVDPLPNSDNLVGIPLMGMTAIVSRGDFVEGELALLIPTECQLSEKMAYFNNLHRHADFNHDTEKPGYLEDNRRVRAIRLRGNSSNALLLKVNALNWVGAFDLEEGMVFDRLNGEELVRKYVKPFSAPRNLIHSRRKIRQARADFARVFPHHPDTANFFRVSDTLDPKAPVVVTQKLHGTAIRIAYLPVLRKLTFMDKVARFLGANVDLFEYDIVVGSHKALKGEDKPEFSNHFYKYDVWADAADELYGLLPKDFVVYGELVGFVPQPKVRVEGDGERGTIAAFYPAIQPGYTYGQRPGTFKMYVYRVARVNEDGVITDLTWDQTVKFCRQMGLDHVPELARGKLGEIDYTAFMERKFHEEGIPGTVPLSEDSPCDEGICIRIEDGYTGAPEIFKVKSPTFLEHETKALDNGHVEIEDEHAVYV